MTKIVANIATVDTAIATESSFEIVNGICLGYCCLNTRLRQQNIFTSRTCRLDTAQKKGITYLYSLVEKNLDDLEKIVHWNYQHQITIFRMSSEMFPFATHHLYRDEFNLEQFRPKLQAIGALAISFNQRLTFHPGQYTLLSSDREEVIHNSIEDLNFHSQVMDMMGLGRDSIMVTHGGSKSGGKEKALARFHTNFLRLSASAQKRLVLENCENVYSVEDLLPLCQNLQIPLVLDFHHHNLNPGNKKLLSLIEEVLKIWYSRQITPKFHLSESRPEVVATDSMTKKRAHSDYITQLPEELTQIPKEWLFNGKLHLMLEAKMKEDALFKLREKLNRN